MLSQLNAERRLDNPSDSDDDFTNDLVGRRRFNGNR